MSVKNLCNLIMLTFDPKTCRNESEVESKLIVQYLLPELGYNSADWYQEVALGNVRLDFLVFATQLLPFKLSSDSPLSVVIEAKSPNRNLDFYVRRLRQYLTALHTRYGLLTNAKDLRIYERFGNDIKQIFRCDGEEISNKMDEIRGIIGRDAIKQRPQQDPIGMKGTTTKGNRKMKVLAIYHNKGGVGKTTVSVNLAAALRRKGYNVLLVDLDSQANSTFAAGLVKFQFEEDDHLKYKNVLHLLQSADFNSIQDIARQSSDFNSPEFDIVPSHISLIAGQYELNQISASKTRLIKKLKQAEGKYDFVIIDTPPSRDIYAQIAMIAADYLIIPSDLKPFANQGLANVSDFIKEIDEFRESLGKDSLQVLGVLPSKISPNAKSFEKTFPKQRDAILNHYSFSVMESVIFDRVALSHCLNQTITVGELEIPDPKSIFDYADKQPSANQSAEEFEQLVAEVLKKMEAV
jgi:chromosome partitioning protein